MKSMPTDFDNSALKIVWCHDASCSGGTSRVIDDSGVPGQPSALTIGTDGLPIMAYFDNDSDSLKVALCGNQFCTPYFRRR